MDATLCPLKAPQRPPVARHSMPKFARTPVLLPQGGHICYLTLQRKRDERSFEVQDLTILVAFLHLLTIALDNSSGA